MSYLPLPLLFSLRSCLTNSQQLPQSLMMNNPHVGSDRPSIKLLQSCVQCCLPLYLSTPTYTCLFIFSQRDAVNLVFSPRQNSDQRKEQRNKDTLLQLELRATVKSMLSRLGQAGSNRNLRTWRKEGIHFTPQVFFLQWRCCSPPPFHNHSAPILHKKSITFNHSPTD